MITYLHSSTDNLLLMSVFVVFQLIPPVYNLSLSVLVFSDTVTTGWLKARRAEI